MRRSLFILPVLALSLIVASCASEKKYSEYQCPMKCEGSKTYDHPGSCPVCGMELEGLASKKR